MEKQFLLIKDNKVVNVTIGVSLEETQKHFPDFIVEEFIERDIVHEKYGVSRFFPPKPDIKILEKEALLEKEE